MLYDGVEMFFYNLLNASNGKIKVSLVTNKMKYINNQRPISKVKNRNYYKFTRM